MLSEPGEAGGSQPRAHPQRLLFRALHRRECVPACFTMASGSSWRESLQSLLLSAAKRSVLIQASAGGRWAVGGLTE